MTNKYEYEQDEPFGWYDGIGFSTNKNDFGKAISTATPLYTHPAPQPAQEPVAWNEEEFNAIAYAYKTCPAHEIKMVSDRYQELVNYVLSITHPAPSWQSLSDDEIDNIWSMNFEFGFRACARAIEQALKEKNT